MICIVKLVEHLHLWILMLCVKINYKRQYILEHRKALF